MGYTTGRKSNERRYIHRMLRQEKKCRGGKTTKLRYEKMKKEQGNESGKIVIQPNQETDEHESKRNEYLQFWQYMQHDPVNRNATSTI